jgi:hypothetical protein
VDNGANTLLYSDRWLFGCCLRDLAPEVVAVVPLKHHKLRMVVDALFDQSWFRDVEGGLSMIRLFDYFQLWISSKIFRYLMKRIDTLGGLTPRVHSHQNMPTMPSSRDPSLLILSVYLENLGTT